MLTSQEKLLKKLELCQRWNKKLRKGIWKAAKKIHDFEGHKRTPEAIRDDLMGGSDENKTR